MLNKIFLLIGFCLMAAWTQAQQDTTVIQFSGLVLVEEAGELIPLPLTNILLEESGRGTFQIRKDFSRLWPSRARQWFFSSVGFSTVEFVIPDTLTETRYSMYQIMTKDTLNLPTAVVYPWPSREHFKIEFLALDVPDELQDRAEANLANAAIDKLREGLPADGYETGGYYLKRQADSYYSFGQAKPIHVLNPIAWAKFFKAWKKGDFKRKKK